MKKKKVYIIVVMFVIIVLWVLIYIKTDFLKTKEQLFWKNAIVEKDNVVEMLSNDIIKEYSDTIKDSSYVKTGTISLKSKYNLIKPLNVNILKKGNNQTENMNIDIAVEYNNKNMANTSIIKDEDYYFIKNENVNNKYIAFENNNLKQLAQKLGISNVDFVPDKIKNIDYYELFSITKQETNHIIIKYVPIFRKYIKNKKYSIERNIAFEENVDRYILEINKKELYNVLEDILNELLKDDITLQFISDKIKIIDESNKYCDIDNIKQLINNWKYNIEQININSIGAENNLLSIIIYKKENDITKVEFDIKNNRTISLSLNEVDNIITIKQFNVQNKDIELNTIQGICTTILNNILEFNYKRSIKDNKVNVVEYNIVCLMGIEQIILNYKYNEEINNNSNLINKTEIEYIDIKEIIYSNCYEIIKNIFNNSIK